MKNHFKIWIIVLLQAFLNEIGFTQNNVTIGGKLNDLKGNTIEIHTPGFNIYKSKNIAKAVVNDLGIFRFNFNISKPQVLQFCRPSFYVTPKDSVFGVFKGGFFFPESIEFTGRNADNYNYTMKYFGLKQSLPFKYYTYDLNKGLSNYLDSLNATKNKLLNFLNEYSNSHKLTNDFKAYAKSQIVYDYYYQLLNPFVYKKYPIEQIPTDYASILDQIKLNNDSLYDKNEYAYAAYALIQYKIKKQNNPELNIINDNSSGLTKEYLLTKYANDLILNYSSKDSITTKEIFKKIDLQITNSEFRKSLSSSKTLLNKCLASFPKDVMQTMLTDSLGQKLTFKSLLGKSKILILDFWASWCGPCKDGMPELNKVKRNFNSSDAEFVFISLDETEKNWRSSMKQLKVPGKHYRVNENFKSAVAKYFEINTIPRYVIINSSGKIEKMYANSPIPGEYGLEVQILKLLND